MTYEILTGDCRTSLRSLDAGSVHTCVTSPPYFGLRDYGHAGQIGLESTPDAYVAQMVEVFREVRRVLRDDGTLWLNLGDSYAGSGRGGNTGGASTLEGGQDTQRASEVKRTRNDVSNQQREAAVTVRGSRLPAGFHASAVNAGALGRSWVPPPVGFKHKDLMGMPWRVALALQADGWWLRQDIIWHKPNPMPEQVRDRCTKAHEYIFLLSKSERYHFDHLAMQEPSVESKGPGNKRNKRSVWTVTTKPYKGAHFATFPPDLIEPCVLAGAPEGGLVLDPFGGSGTTAAVALKHGRRAVLCELNPAYVKLAEERIAGVLVGDLL